jgi:hypothetical protein
MASASIGAKHRILFGASAGQCDGLHAAHRASGGFWKRAMLARERSAACICELQDGNRAQDVVVFLSAEEPPTAYTPQTATACHSTGDSTGGGSAVLEEGCACTTDATHSWL